MLFLASASRIAQWTVYRKGCHSDFNAHRQKNAAEQHLINLHVHCT